MFVYEYIPSRPHQINIGSNSAVFGEFAWSDGPHASKRSHRTPDEYSIELSRFTLQNMPNSQSPRSNEMCYSCAPLPSKNNNIIPHFNMTMRNIKTMMSTTMAVICLLSFAFLATSPNLFLAPSNRP